MKMVRPAPFDWMWIVNGREKHRFMCQVRALAVGSTMPPRNMFTEAPPVAACDWGQVCTLFLCMEYGGFIVPLKWRQNPWSRLRPRTWFIKSLGGMVHSAVNYQVEHSIPSSDLYIVRISLNTLSHCMLVPFSFCENKNCTWIVVVFSHAYIFFHSFNMQMIWNRTRPRALMHNQHKRELISTQNT